MTKPESKNASGRLFDSILSDDDDLSTTSSDTHGSHGISNIQNTREQKLQVKRIHDEKEESTTSPKHSLNVHKDPFVPPVPFVLSSHNQPEAHVATALTNSQLQESIKIGGMVFMNEDHTQIPAVDTQPNTTKDPASPHSELVTDGSVFRLQSLDLGSPHAMSSKVLLSSSNTREPPKLGEESDHNLSGASPHVDTLPTPKQPIAVDFPNIQTGGAAEARNIEEQRGFPERGMAPDVSVHSPHSLLPMRQFEAKGVSPSLIQQQNDSEMDHYQTYKCPYLAAYIFPRLDASLVNSDTKFTYENPPPNCVESCIAFLLRVDPRMMVYFLVLLVSVFLTFISVFAPQIVHIQDSCYTYWGYKANCTYTSYTTPVLLIKDKKIKNALYNGCIFSIITLILYLLALIFVWVYIFCIDKPPRNMPKIHRWRIGVLGFCAFIMHCVAWVLILHLYRTDFHNKETEMTALGLGFDFSLTACLIHSLGLTLFLFVPYSKILCI
ncbi:unnamed protein product [Phytomonas sp. EM1]|nr:unnamed protein product [Phytomonas sp. EM1]|eukprot:CCW62343.1 unnamed protein product [Phytomonas sp. isolate EM1]